MLLLLLEFIRVGEYSSPFLEIDVFAGEVAVGRSHESSPEESERFFPIKLLVFNSGEETSTKSDAESFSLKV